MTIDEINLAFAGKFVGDGPMLLLRSLDALDYIQIANSKSLRLLGIEGFRILSSGAVQPDMRLAVEARNSEDYQEELERARSTIRSCVEDPSIVFEVYLEESSSQSFP